MKRDSTQSTNARRENLKNIGAGIVKQKAWDMQNRQKLFENTAHDLGKIKPNGLGNLTVPHEADNVKTIVDVLIFGTKDSGKTQFLAHVARSLGMEQIAGLCEAEETFNGDLRKNALKFDYRIFATTDTEVVHYVLQGDAARLAETVLDSNSWTGFKVFSRRSNFFSRFALRIGAVLAAHIAFAVYLLPLLKPTTAVPWWLIAIFLLSALAVTVRVWETTWNALANSGKVEIVLWDFAGEHFRKNKDQYLHFIQTLVRRRQELHTLPGSAHYAFLPVLIFDPLQVEHCENLRSDLFQVVHYTAKITSDVLIVVPRNRLLEEIRRIQDEFVGIVKKPARGKIPQLISQPVTHQPGQTGEEHLEKRLNGHQEGKSKADQQSQSPVNDLKPEHFIKIIRPAEVSKACREENLKRRIHRSQIRTLYYDADPDATCKPCQKQEAQACINKLAEAEKRPWPLFDFKVDVDGNIKEVKTFLIYEYEERKGNFSEAENGNVFFDWLGSNIWPINWDKIQAFVPPDPKGSDGSVFQPSQTDPPAQSNGFSTGS